MSLSVTLVQATYPKGSYVIREPEVEVGVIRRLGIDGLEDEVSTVATSIWRGVTYRTGIIEHLGIEHHRVRVEAVGLATYRFATSST